jgi:hypothetical protein
MERNRKRRGLLEAHRPTDTLKKSDFPSGIGERYIMLLSQSHIHLINTPLKSELGSITNKLIERSIDHNRRLPSP